MTRDQIAEKLRTLVGQEIGLPEDEITHDSTFVEDLGCDSLDLAEIVIVAEEQFGLSIDDDIAEQLSSFGALVDHIHRLLSRKVRASA